MKKHQCRHSELKSDKDYEGEWRAFCPICRLWIPASCWLGYVPAKEKKQVNYAYVSLESAKHLFHYKDGVSGIEFRLKSINDAASVRENLASHLGDQYSVSHMV